MLIGMKSILALAAGGILVLIGLVGLALVPMLATQTIPERRSRRLLTAIVSALRLREIAITRPPRRKLQRERPAPPAP